MTSWLLATASAFWLGVLTSLSPCPLAANIAAISYVGRDVGSRRRVLLSGFLYTLGRMTSYVMLAVVLIAGLLSIPQVALFLQRYMNQVMGPLLVVVGLLLLEVMPMPSFGGGLSARLSDRVRKAGMLGALPFGAVLALAFCPVSAALFFGGLVPLALDNRSSMWLPAVYGVGTGLPVVVFAILLGVGVRWIGQAFNRIAVIERWARRVTAVVVMAIGAYYTWTFMIGGASTL
ncbi:MAG: sulfite exporter TauE/SafE family protein [Vicinamibacteria bacterium]|nr:sulfite exporter TauE/SafE family protein [Vicinamibacteria bacterium]